MSPLVYRPDLERRKMEFESEEEDEEEEEEVRVSQGDHV